MVPNRHGSTADYRYGFQGQEKDDEIKGEGNYIAYEDRGYDPRVGRFISVDAYANAMPSQSPYSFALNNPIYFVDENGNWPKPSDLLPKNTPPMIKGIVDGVWEGLTGSVGFAYDYATDSKFREQVNQSFTNLIKDPMGTLEGIIESYAGKIERLATGKATDDDLYDVGSEIGEAGVGILLGGATLGVKALKKVAKPDIDAGDVAKKAKKDAKKATKKQDPNKPSGFYDVRGVENETIYVGKGPSKRAAQSLKVRQGEKVISYTVTEGVGDLNVRQTAFAFEELLLRKAEKAGANLLNDKTSPGKKILDNLEKNNPEAFQQVKEAFEKKMAEGGKEVKPKS